MLDYEINRTDAKLFSKHLGVCRDGVMLFFHSSSLFIIIGYRFYKINLLFKKRQ